MPAIRGELLMLFLVGWLRLVSSVSQDVCNSLQLCLFLSFIIYLEGFKLLLDTWKNVCLLSEFYVPCFDTFQVRVLQAGIVTSEKMLSFISFQFATYNVIMCLVLVL